MSNTFGSMIRMTVFGESHGPAVGVVLDGLAPGIPVDEDAVRHELDLRRPADSLSTARREADEFVIESGVFRGMTTGTPVAIVIPNHDARSGDYSYGVARPGHADLTARLRYGGFEDYRGGGHFSGRLTAPIAAAGGILRGMLKAKGILIGTHICSLMRIYDRAFGDYAADIEALHNRAFPVLDDGAADAMRAVIEAARAEGDSVGGMLETAVLGIPGGVGEPFFDSVESVLSHLMFSVPAVKSVEFGEGVNFANLRGSEANDAIRTDGEDGFSLVTNHSGDIGGGITNGAPILMRLTVRATPTIAKAQDSVNFVTHENVVCESRGRHDPCVAHRARAAVDALSALGIADLLAVRYGPEWLRA